MVAVKCQRIPVARGVGLVKHTHGHQPSSSKARQSTHAVQQYYVLGNAAAEAADGEGDGRDEEANTPSEDVTDSPVERLESRACNEIRGGQPGSGICSVELGADNCVRRCRDGAVEPVKEDI